MRTIIAIASLFAAAVCLAPAAHADTASSYCAINVTQAQLVCASSPTALDSAWAQRELTPETQVLIARLYDNANYDTSAGYLNVYSAADCTATGTDIDYSLSNLGTWSDRVSSFSSYGNCATRLWTGTGFTGTAYPGSGSWAVDSSYVGAAMNDQASSAQFT